MTNINMLEEKHFAKKETNSCSDAGNYNDANLCLCYFCHGITT